MLPELTLLRHLATVLCDRWRALRADPEAGYTTETVIVTALLAALAPTAALTVHRHSPLRPRRPGGRHRLLQRRAL